MLVLSRKLGQSFQVGPDIRVTIVRIDRTAIRIGIEAPDGVSIKREEITMLIRPEESQASAGLV